jgi:hypothetical protein
MIRGPLEGVGAQYKGVSCPFSCTRVHYASKVPYPSANHRSCFIQLIDSAAGTGEFGVRETSVSDREIAWKLESR